MAEYKWPAPAERTLIGKRISRVDGPVKVSGHAKYSYDYNPKGLLFGKVLRCPYAHARITSIDTSAAEKMPGVKAVQVVQKPGTEVLWAGDDIVAVAAVDEPTAEDAIRAIQVKYEVLPEILLERRIHGQNLTTDHASSPMDVVPLLKQVLDQRRREGW